MAALLPEGKQSFVNSAGLPLVGGRVYTYDAGTSTPRTTWADAAESAPNTNPVILDARGEATIFWRGAYKVTLRDASDNLIWTVDNVSGVSGSDLSAASGAGLVGFNYADTYPLGSLGRWLKDLATTSGSSVIGFQAAGASAVVRSAQAKLRELVHVTDFGADPTGATGAASAIQTALNSGARVVRAKGSFLIDADLILPDGVIFDAIDAVLLASADGRTIIKSNVSSYYSQILGGVWDGNGRANVTAMDLSNFRLRSLVLAPLIRDCANGIIARTGCFGARLADVATERVTNAITVMANGSVLAIDNPAIDNSPSIGGSGAGIGIDIRLGAQDNIGVQVRGGFVQGHTTGIRDAGIKTVVSDTYIELCSAADIDGTGARASQYRAVQHYGPSGAAGYRLRNCDAVTIFDPTMASGARTVLYDVDGSNTNCIEYRTDSNAFLNLPTGSLANLGQIPRQTTGTWTPVVVGSISAGTGTYTAQQGTWTRTGNLVTVHATVSWSAHTGTGNMSVTGLPAALGAASTTPLRMLQLTVTGLPITGPVLYASPSGVGSALALAQQTTAGGQAPVPIGASGSVHISGTYQL